MALPSMPARFVALDLPTSTVDSEMAITTRLTSTLRKFRKRGLEPVTDGENCAVTSDPSDAFESWLEAADLGPQDIARVKARAARFHAARQRKIAALAHLKPDERKLTLATARGSHARGVVNRHRMEELIADLHALYPWLAPASTAVMRHMRLRTHAGPAPMHMPPLILLGPPGIAKSSWARDAARIFGLAEVQIDIGATNGATFAVSGVERGWGSATPGRVVTTMLRERVANPVVILDEIDKIPAQVATSKGTTLPGAFEVLKSMIEPATAKVWTCPFHQIPFDLTGVSWIMTTNSIDHLPEAFLDRCKLIRLENPTSEQLLAAGNRMIAARLPEAWHGTACDLLQDALRQAGKKHIRTSLRAVERMVEVISGGLDQPMVM